MGEIELTVRVYPEDLGDGSWKDKAQSAVYEWCHLHIAPRHAEFRFALEDVNTGYPLSAPEDLVLGQDA